MSLGRDYLRLRAYLAQREARQSDSFRVPVYAELFEYAARREARATGKPWRGAAFTPPPELKIGRALLYPAQRGGAGIRP